MKLGLGLGLQKTGKKEYYLEFDGLDDYGDGGTNSLQLGLDNSIIGLLVNIPARNDKVGYGKIIVKSSIVIMTKYFDGNDSTCSLYFVQDGTNVTGIALEYGKTYMIISQRYNATDGNPDNCNIRLKTYCYEDTVILSSSARENYARVNNDTGNLQVGYSNNSSYYQGKLAHIFASKGSQWNNFISDNLIQNLAGNSPKNAPDPRKIISNVTDFFPTNEGHGTTVGEKINGNDITLYGGATPVEWGKW